MPVHLQKEINRLKKMALSLSARVEENLRSAVRAVTERNGDLARLVIGADREIDRTEVDVEEECLKILALHQPVANDLRYIVAILKINHDLERVGDLAVSIAERAEAVAAGPAIEIPFDLSGLAAKVQSMLAESLEAMIDLNAGLARRVCLSDDEIDRRNREAHAEITKCLRAKDACVEGLLSLLSVSRNLERVGDHATNIAKDVLYIVEGEIFRHRSGEFRKDVDEGKQKTGKEMP